MIIDFLNNEHIKTLYIYSNNAGEFLPNYGFSSNAKGKSCYFMKRKQMAVTSENFHKATNIFINKF